MAGQSISAAEAGTITIGSALTVNRMGFGAMRLTGQGILGDPPDRDEAKRVLRRALELGVDFIDTADSYGPRVSEELITTALFPYPADLVIATKGGLLRPAPGPWVPDGRPEHLRDAVEGSLRMLHLDQIPLYQLHRPDPNVPIEESVGALAGVQREGKIRFLGLSNVNESLLRRAQKEADIVSVQNRYNPLDRSSEAVLAICEHEGMVFLPWAPLGQGNLADPVLAEIAGHCGSSVWQVVLTWLLAHSKAILLIPGTSSVAHLEQNLIAGRLRLAAKDIRRIDSMSGVRARTVA
jgi:aryl-alcohol dehydrogenase-like predicted oxidoreductase